MKKVKIGRIWNKTQLLFRRMIPKFLNLTIWGFFLIVLVRLPIAFPLLKFSAHQKETSPLTSLAAA